MIKLTKIKPVTIYAIRITERGELQFHNGEDWVILGKVVGEAGAKGEKGDSIRGPKGDSIRGPVGAKGDKGDIGAKGDTGAVGTTPKHEWNTERTRIRFETDTGVWGDWSAELKGENTIITLEKPVTIPAPAPAQQPQTVISGGGGSAGYTTWREVTADTALRRNDEGLILDASAGDIAVTLPNSADYTTKMSPKQSKVFWLYRTDASANKITINTFSGQTLNGASSAVLVGSGAAVKFFSKGTSGWFVMSENFSTTLRDIDADGNLIISGGLRDNS